MSSFAKRTAASDAGSAASLARARSRSLGATSPLLATFVRKSSSLGMSGTPGDMGAATLAAALRPVCGEMLLPDEKRLFQSQFIIIVIVAGPHQPTPHPAFTPWRPARRSRHG